MDYTKADSLLEGRCKLQRKVGNNTYLVRNSGVPGDSIHLKLHDTYIITWYQDGRTELNSGGWRTVTTKARLNEHLSGHYISQVKGQWYVCRYQNGKHEDVCMFEDGVTIHADGTITDGSPIEDAKRLLSLRRRVNKFASAYAQAFGKGEVEAPGLGDCFYCAMREVGTGKPLGECSHNSDHLISHLDESYFVPSILNRAMETVPVSPAFKQSVAAYWTNQPELAFFKRDYDWFLSQIKSAVSKYMLRQLGQAT